MSKYGRVSAHSWLISATTDTDLPHICKISEALWPQYFDCDNKYVMGAIAPLVDSPLLLIWKVNKAVFWFKGFTSNNISKKSTVIGASAPSVGLKG